MSDAAGIDDLDEVRITATTGYRQTGEDEDYMRQCCARIEALLRNRQELVDVLEAFRADPVASIDLWEAAGAEEAYSKAKELDND